MSSLSTWLWGTSQLDDAIDKATSELLPAGAEDIALNLEICDQIRSKSVPAKDAMRGLKRRLNHKNPNVQLLALGLTDICIKNGGDLFLNEVASREFMDNLVSILKVPALNLEVKNAILRLIQNWSVAFEAKANLTYVGQVYKTLKNEGYKFPPRDLALANSAMVDTQIAPEWIDSEVCLRCRTSFTFTNRKHHCRNCGQVFDQQCSSKSMPLPHFGITQDVRVCDGCYNKILKKSEKTDKGHRHSHSVPSSRHRSARELADAELQRAIQLSLQEVGSGGSSARPGYVSSQPPAWQYSEPPLVDRTQYPSARDTKPFEYEDEDDRDLKAAIEASLREAQAPKPSAPVAVETPQPEEPSWQNQGYSQSYPPSVLPLHPTISKIPNYDLEPLESDVILTFSQTVDQVQSQGGRDMSRYPAVNELYEKANGLRPKLALSLDDTGRKEQVLSDMHDKLSQAVKLYDQLLTEQVSQPRWRSPQQAAPYQAHPAYAAQAPPNGFSQWVPQSQATSSAPPPETSIIQPQSPAVSYNVLSQPQYAPPHVQTYTSEDLVQPQWYQLQQPQQQQYSELTPPIQYHASSPRPPAIHQPLHAEPLQSQYQPEPAAVRYASPSPQQHSYQVSDPASIIHSPPPAQYASLSSASVKPVEQAFPQTSPLARQSTVSYAPTPQPSNRNTYLSRHNTVAHAPSPHQQQLSHQQQHSEHYVQQPSQPALPQFPVAPTSAPQTFSMYELSIPSSAPTERKEALLIDL